MNHQGRGCNFPFMIPRPSKEECAAAIRIHRGTEAFTTLEIVRWCARECERQQSGEMSVSRMYDAWTAALSSDQRPVPITEETIRLLGRLVDPRNTGYRTVNVRVGYSVKGPWQEVPRQVESLVEALPQYVSEDDRIEWFRLFEEVHPFVDGNGRTGALLLNMLAGTIRNPVDAPDLWSEAVWLGPL